MERLREVKASVKKNIEILKEKYFSKKSPFMEKIKHLYTTVKGSLRK